MKSSKPFSRRDFIGTSLKIGIGLPLITNPLVSACGRASNIKPLEILILGGTSFLGPPQIAYALERGHKISTFTRGKTIPTTYVDVFDKVESLIGDRNGKFDALKDRRWDVIIDNSGNQTKWVEDTAELLKDSTDLYLFTSSTGVYFPYLGKDIDEDTVVLDKVPDGIDPMEKIEYDWGVMKTTAEQAVQKFLGEDRTLVVRPTYMMGPGDKTDRFTYWPERLSRGGDIMVPGKPTDPVQYIDVRDVAEWMIRLVEEKTTGTFNAVGPAEPQNMEQFISTAETAFEIEKEFTYISDYEFLKKHGVLYSVPWILPEGNVVGSARISIKKALSSGLTIRPLIESVKDLHRWWHSDVVSDDRRENLMEGKRSMALKEEEMLKEWRELKGM